MATDLAIGQEESEVMAYDVHLDGIDRDPLDFDSWTSHISLVEKLYTDDEGKISSTYDSFLSEFPLCYGYWRKYAAHRIRLSTFDKIIEVYERAVQAVTYSVDVWLDYCVFCMSLFPDPNDVRRQFKRGLSYVGRDYLCHTLWDKYIEFEFSQQEWSALAYIYIQTLRYPKNMLQDYYERFTQLVAMFKEEMEHQGTFSAEIESDPMLDDEVSAVYKDEEVMGIIKGLLDESDSLSKFKAWRRYKLIGESLYRDSSIMNEKINFFEKQIGRRHFNIKPLIAKELEILHQYLDFVEKQGDFEWAVKLYERCLIACALYPEFWIRYVQLLETKGGRELAKFALDRATKTFLKAVPSIHLFNARYKEQIRDFFSVRAAFPKLNSNELNSEYISNIMKEANMENRLGNLEAAYKIYREAILLTTERQRLDLLAPLYINYSRLTYKATNSVSAAIDILSNGLKQIPHCKSVLEELIKLGMMHGGPMDRDLVESIISNAITANVSEAFGLEDKESMSLLYLEFVDLYGTIDDLMKAWSRHIKLFPHSVRTASNGGSSTKRESVEVLALNGKDLGFDVATPTDRATTLDRPDNSYVDHEAEPREAQRAEASETEQNKEGNVFVLLSKTLAENLTVDSSHKEISDCEPMQDAKESNTSVGVQQEDHHGIEQNLNSIALVGDALGSGDKRSPIATTTSDIDFRDLQDISRKRNQENSHHVPDQSPPVSSSAQHHHPSESLLGASSDSGQGLRGNFSNNDQRTFERSLSPAGTPRSVSSGIAIASRDPSYVSYENSALNIQNDPETSQAWHQRRRPDRFSRDTHSRYQNDPRNRPHRQQRVSPPRNSRSENDHIITIQRSSIQPFPVNSQQAQGNQPQFQQPCPTTQFYPGSAYSCPEQNMQSNIADISVSQPTVQLTDQASIQMPQYPVQASDATGQMQNQEGYNQMMQYYYYQQQVLLQQQQQYPQPWQQHFPEQWQQQLQQQLYWQQLQYQQQVQAQASTQQPTQAAMQMQQLTQASMQQMTQASMQQQQQQQDAQALQQQGNQALLLHQQQLQQLLELQQLRKQQQEQEHQQLQPQPAQDRKQDL